jgi:hypothetical protein
LSAEASFLFRKLVWKEYYAARFFLAHSNREPKNARDDGIRAIWTRPSWLMHRGFMSLWLESLLGRKSANLLRRIV